MAIIGPRPLLVRYLARYNEEQHHRHDVRPGLTGYAQAHGRNAVSWEDKFARIYTKKKDENLQIIYIYIKMEKAVNVLLNL